MTHVNYFPENVLIPMIEKININRLTTSIKFPIAGMACKSAVTTNLSPSFLLITLKGLSARKARRALSAFSLLFPELESTQSIIEMETIKKSSWFQPCVS